MPTRIRLRQDSCHAAELHAQALAGKPPACQCGQDNCPYLPEVYGRTPPAVPGDAWRINWYRQDGDGPLAGFAICCPKCRQIHRWTSANNCGSRRSFTFTGTDGKEYTGTKCDHSGTASCWTWTIEDAGRPLKAVASLHETGDCGYHGWLGGGGAPLGYLSDG